MSLLTHGPNTILKRGKIKKYDFLWGGACSPYIFINKGIDKEKIFCYNVLAIAAMAQLVEHILGKDEVTSSNLVSSSTACFFKQAVSFFL